MFAILAVLLIGGFARVDAANPKPYFNVYKDVANVGDEADFVRVSQIGANSFSNNVEACTDGQEVAVRIYIHNGASEQLNGTNYDGPGVALGTKLAINVPKTVNNQVTATVSANNADAVTDGATVSCNGQALDLTYVPNSAVIKNTVQNYAPLGDAVFNGGTPIGYEGQNGVFPGCWDFVTYVYAKVVVKKKPVQPPVSTAVCKLNEDTFIVTDKRKVTLTVSAEVTNATVLGYEINWGDESPVSTKQTDSHQYQTEKDATYKIQARVQVKLADGTVKWVDGANCTKTLVFKGKKVMCTIPGKEHLPADSPECKTTTTPPPTTPPSGKLPDTGAGNLFGIFTVVSMVGAFLHKRYTARKLDFNL